MGETVVTSSQGAKPKILYEEIMRKVCKDVGYDDEDKGLDYRNMTCFINVVPQS